MSASTLFEDCGSGMITVASFLQYFKNNFLNYQVSILTLHSGKSLFFPKTSVAIVILFWLKWAGYLAMAGLNLLAQLSDRISPSGV